MGTRSSENKRLAPSQRERIGSWGGASFKVGQILALAIVFAAGIKKTVCVRPGTSPTDVIFNLVRIGTSPTDAIFNLVRIGTSPTDVIFNLVRIGTSPTDVIFNLVRIGTSPTDVIICRNSED